MTTFVEAYHRVGGDLDMLQNGFHLETWQLYAAMTFYCANKELFDAEHEHILEERQRNVREFAPVSQDLIKSLFENVPPSAGEEATDEETDAAVERMS